MMEEQQVVREDLIPQSQLYSLRQLHVSGKKLRTSLELTMTGELGDLIVSDAVLSLYGVGATPEDALADYEAMLLDTYEQLRANADHLSPRLQRQLRYLDFLLA